MKERQTTLVLNIFPAELIHIILFYLVKFVAFLLHLFMTFIAYFYHVSREEWTIYVDEMKH